MGVVYVHVYVWRPDEGALTLEEQERRLQLYSCWISVEDLCFYDRKLLKAQWRRNSYPKNYRIEKLHGNK